MVSFMGCNTKNEKDRDEDNVVMHGDMPLDSIYKQMPQVSLPLSFHDVIANEEDFYEIPDNLLYLLGDNDPMDTGFNVARLPEKGNFHPFLLSYMDRQNNLTMEIRTFTEDLKPVAMLQVYSIEELAHDTLVIAQLFDIYKDYTIRTYKVLDDVTIEELCYHITEDGMFEETRDGKIPVTAFDSYDGEHYIVEKFIWDHNENGGLFKKDLQTFYYKITEDGDVMQTDKAGEEL